MANDPKISDLEKEAAARASLRFVRDGNVVGLGTGSTAAYAVRFLAEQVGGIEDSRHSDFCAHSRASR